MTDSFEFPVRADEREPLARVARLADEFRATAAEFDERAEIPVAHLAALHEAGLDRAVLPDRVGGTGLSYRAFGWVVRTLAAADPSIATIWTMHAGAGVALAEITAETMGSFFAEEFLAGKRFANALSEPASGNRFLQPQQVAEPGAGGWTLTGAKRFVSGAEIADYLLVNALVDGQPTFFGVVPDDTVSVIPIWDTLGLRATRSQLLSFDRTVLRAEYRGRRPGPGDFAVIPAGLPAISLGIADAALDALVEHARSREILGAPLAHQQWVQYEVADVQTRLAAAHALYERALDLADNAIPAALPTMGRAKYLANKVAVDVAQLGVRVGGASGYLKRSPIQRHLRDAEAGQLMAYSTEVLAGVIGREVLGVEEG
ncbi:acyl-CoA/acyl-ACP dehydrogenase [Nocardia puris]|uniref:Alkylation response protein AidB-like acyl-CoA dehydrogenase n=1 Tax=Nocardia puris TaxID=208602 RepID=A0A366D9I5_9NOCA|nr:acyl-CoA dehydrogenase family protein [Nocardia puris]MBF6214095.1 acyl-CoA/acyl-ACP dehydrogenase [Nocardia puris]MBF6368621.1 acyl-CoA/acyl-ACP dehydrogenase [Nocardia puris]MBF6461523.1 acyl-CoA/acyl-ACP dehydrogenase [Nocardia puris]RBO86605.1 alkylation response protein AidB-like acyl-CoA dehydrogenase [Nocardia puris]